MTTLLNRIISEIRFWFGWSDPSEEHASPSHGWLLQPPSAVRALHGDAKNVHLTAAAAASRLRG
jgi:hypothetical protein